MASWLRRRVVSAFYGAAGFTIATASFALVSGSLILWMMVIGTLPHDILSLASAPFKGWSKALGIIGAFLIIMAIMASKQTRQSLRLVAQRALRTIEATVLPGQ